MLKNGIFLGKRYEILSRIGAGGMADVYKAKDHKLNRFVAIKVLKREFREDSKFVSKFRVEAQSAAGLMHPNIVNVYDVADEQGISYMVMELVEGITLKDYIEKRGQLSAREAISISIQVASGIEAAHRNHIVHRDIKPQNIIISREGKVKVTDFGIARAASVNTISSNAMGSVHYTSPEQARGGYSDFKSDIYSLGITMYEMLTGRVPFDGDSTVTIAIKHLQEEMEPPSTYAPNMPTSMEQIILKCCQKSPDRRYSSMGELIGDLKQSLVNPNGDFVRIPLPAGEETVMFDPETMETLRNSYKEQGGRSEYPRNFDRYDEDDYEDDSFDEYDDSYDQDHRYREEDEYDDGYDDYDHRDVNPGMEKVMKVLMIVAAIIMAALIIFFVGKAVGIFKFGPSLPSISTEKPAEPEDNTVEVPSFIGMTMQEATEAANELGLGVRQDGSEESRDYDTGLVIRQSVESGTRVEPNSTIGLTTSSGLVGNTVTVPSVVGQSQENAESILGNAGFQVNATFEENSEVDQGFVISQSPNSGSDAGEGATISIVVSKGNSKGEVPDLEGVDRETAEKMIREAELSVGTVDEEYDQDAEEGKVFWQNTDPGSVVPKGTAISFTVSKGDLPLEDQVWECNASINLTESYIADPQPVNVVLEQDGEETVITENETLSNPYPLQVKGIPGCDHGTVTVYLAESGDAIGSTTVSFSRIK